MSKYPQRNSFEMAAHELDVKWNSPLERLKRAVAESREQRQKAHQEFERIWGLSNHS